MVEECAHILADGRKCQRIPKRGDRFCPAHRTQGRRPFEPLHALQEEMTALVDRLEKMPLHELLYTAGNYLTLLEPLIQRRFSRVHRRSFIRTILAVQVAADRVEVATHKALPQPAAPPAPPLSPAAQSHIRQLNAILHSGRQLSLDELESICTMAQATFNPDTNPDRTLSPDSYEPPARVRQPMDHKTQCQPVTHPEIK